MKNLIALSVYALILLSSSANADDTEFQKRLSLAQEVVEISQADQLMVQMTNAIVAGQVQAMDVMFAEMGLTDRQKKEIIDEMSKIISEELEPALAVFAEKQAPLLADVYTYEELDGILTFYKSPAGQAMLHKQGELLEKSTVIGQQWNAENLPGMLKRITPRIEEVVQNALKGI